MLAMPGMRAFSLAAKRGNEGVSCDASGVFVGGVPLLHPPSAERQYWTVRPAAEINEELTVRYGLPIDFGSKAGAVSLIAAALNRGDLAIASIAVVQMQFPDPPPFGKTGESQDEVVRRARELDRSGLLKFFWNPAQHPRAGVPLNPGWFTLVGDKPEHLEVIPGNSNINPADKPWEPPPAEGEEGEYGPRGIVELPLLGGSPGASSPDAAPKPSAPLDSQPSLPFPGGLPRQIAPGVAADVSGEGSPTQVPARGGRLGNAATRAQNAAIAAELENQGYAITSGGGTEQGEEFISGGGPGTRGGTFVDITAVNKATGQTLRIQTVDTLADGTTPTPREQAAIARILSTYPNDELWVIPKRKLP